MNVPETVPMTRPWAAPPPPPDALHPMKMILCGHCGHFFKVTLGCGDRTCPACRKKWYGHHFKMLVDLVSGWPSLRFMTLTLKNVPDSDFSKYHIKFLRKCFARLRARFPKVFSGGFYVVQDTNSGNGHHPHLHVLYDGLFIAQKDLKKAWSEITGGSFIVDIRAVPDPKGAVHYLLKDFLQAPRIRPEDRDTFNEVFKGSRMVQGFGRYSKTKFRVPYKCPKCGESCWLDEDALDALLHPGEKRTFRRKFFDDG